MTDSDRENLENPQQRGGKGSTGGGGKRNSSSSMSKEEWAEKDRLTIIRIAKAVALKAAIENTGVDMSTLPVMFTLKMEYPDGAPVSSYETEPCGSPFWSRNVRLVWSASSARIVTKSSLVYGSGLNEASAGSNESIYDPTCGSGGMLLNAVLLAKERGNEYRNIKLYGQEINLITSAIAKMNMFIHGIKDFHIIRGDTLSDPEFLEGDKVKQFDICLANPPYSIKKWNQKAWQHDPWSRNIHGTQLKLAFCLLHHHPWKTVTSCALSDSIRELSRSNFRDQRGREQAGQGIVDVATLRLQNHIADRHFDDVAPLILFNVLDKHENLRIRDP